MRKCLTKFSRIWMRRGIAKQKKGRYFAVLIHSCRAECLLPPSGYMLGIVGIYFLTQCSPYSHCQSSVHGAPSFRYSSRPRCFAVAWWFRLRSRGLRPEDACQKRFSWFSDWSPKVQKCVNLPKTHKCKSCRSRQELSNEHLLAKFGFDTAENEPLKICKKN